MTRAALLLDLLQRLRSHRHPVSGAELAAGLGISLRTLYRDIATLQAPTRMDFGLTFTASDPDGHRLRVFSPAG